MKTRPPAAPACCRAVCAPAERAGPIAEALAAGDVAAVRSLAAGLQAPDMADLMELLQPDQRVQLVQALGAAFDPEVLPELDETVRDQLSEALPNDVLARAVARLETDDAAYVIEGLEKADQQEILAQIPTGDRAALERNLEYPEETAGRLMQTDFVAVPPFWSVGRVIDHMREAQDLPDSFSDIYVVDPTYRVLGSVDLSRLLRTQREVSIDAIMDAGRQVVLATADQEAVARQFERYDLKSAPVVDANKRLVGVVTVDDMVEVIEEEAEEDMRRLGGVGDESVTDSVLYTVRNRFAWLFINLGTALLASSVIKAFDATIEPDGGARRADADRCLHGRQRRYPDHDGGGAGAGHAHAGSGQRDACHPARSLGRLINGIDLRGHHGRGGAVLVRHRQARDGDRHGHDLQLRGRGAGRHPHSAGAGARGFDPAVSSGVFVTMVTDVVGFFAFLGLATLLLL